MANFQNKVTSFASAASRTTTYDAGLRDYMIQVYNKMGIALAISGLVAFLVASSPALMQIVFGPLHILFVLAPLGFVIYFSVKLHSMSAAKAKNCLYLFAGLMGVSLSSLLIVYTGESVAKAFFITASVFGSMSLYGYTTKKDLTSWGSFLFMGIIGILIASLVNLFLGSPALGFAVSVLAVLIFTALTAYDTQKIKQVYYQTGGNSEMADKAATMGALSLYMDFINIFIHLLHLFGNRR